MNAHKKFKLARGFSLIEVLVAVVILSVGLLALASLQLSMIRASGSTKSQTIAAGLAKDKIESMRSFTALSGASGYWAITAPSAGLVENFNDAGTGQYGGVDFVRTTKVVRYVYNTTTPSFRALTNAQNTLTDNQIQALGTAWVVGKDFKKVTVDVSWKDSNGVASSVTMEDIVDSLDPTESGDILSTSSNTSGPRKVEKKIADPALDAMVIPIAVGGGTESAASNPKPTLTANLGADTIETKFDVLTYSGLNSGTATVQARVETAMVGCKCTFDSPPATTVRGMRPTYWNGFRYAVPFFVDPTGPASYSPKGKVDASVTGQSTFCGICCRDHMDPMNVKGPTFSPRLVTKNNLDVVTATSHDHYLATSPTTWNGPRTSGQYSEACRIIRVDGVWSTAADIENDYYDLLATQQLSDPKYYASGYAPDATATVNYQNFVVGYLQARYVASGTDQTNYNTLLASGPVASLESTNQLNLPSQIGIPNTFTGALSTKSISSITRANPAVVTTSAAHGFATDDRVFLASVTGMPQLNGKSYIINVLSSTTFQLVGLDTSTYAAAGSGGSASVNHAKWLHSRGMYADYLEKDALAAIDAAKLGCPSQSGSAYTNCVLQVLPFTSINLTELADWKDNANPVGSVVTVLNNNKYNDSATSVEPIRGKVTWTSGAATGATADVVTTTRRANTSLLDLAQPSISSADAAFLDDTQNFIVGTSSGSGSTAGQFYVNHPGLAKGSDMAISYIANGNPSSSCNYVAANVNWKCPVNGDKVLWTGITDAISIDVTGYNFETIGTDTSAPSTSGCTYAGPETGFPTKSYPAGGDSANNIPAINYTPRTCSDYNVSSAVNATTTIGSGSITYSNLGKKNEVAHIPFGVVNADDDVAVAPDKDMLTLTFTGPSTPTPGAKVCTYTCQQTFGSDCKSNKNTYFVITTTCN